MIRINGAPIILLEQTVCCYLPVKANATAIWFIETANIAATSSDMLVMAPAAMVMDRKLNQCEDAEAIIAEIKARKYHSK